MKSSHRNQGQKKPWGRNRIPTAPPGSRHDSIRDYERHRLPDIEDEWWDELDEWEKRLPIEGDGDD